MAAPSATPGKTTTPSGTAGIAPRHSGSRADPGLHGRHRGGDCGHDRSDGAAATADTTTRTLPGSPVDCSAGSRSRSSLPRLAARRQTRGFPRGPPQAQRVRGRRERWAVTNLGRKQSVEPSCSLRLASGQEVAVAVECDCDRGVAEIAAERFGVDACGDHQRRVGVSTFV